MSPPDLTPNEQRAISALKRLAKRWPPSLWLFSNGSLYVLKTDENGGKAHVRGGGIDPDYVVADIDGIASDGGDW